MNIIDIAILALFAFFVLAGWYRGFLNTLLSLGAYALSCGLAFLLHPLVGGWIRGNEGLYTMALYYTEGAEFVGDAQLSRTNIAELSTAKLTEVLDAADLPTPMSARISENVAREAFAEDGLHTLGEYFNQTIVNVFINIVSILVLFVVIRLVFAFVIHLIDYARRGYPVLQTADGMIGAGLGLIRGFLAMYIFFLIAPAAFTILPITSEYVEASFFGNFFYTSNFLLRLIPG